MAWFVYLARCADGSLYTGVTTDPARRERAHNRGRGAAYTRSRRPVRLVHLEPARDRGAALRRELAIKRLTRAGKEALMGRTGGRTVGRSDGRGFPGFSAEALGFLRRLRRNNRKDWFERNRAVYETAVRDPMRALVEEMDVRLARIAPELMGDPRRSVFRIHRDVRFSRDKSPYKTNAACQFYHMDAGRGAGRDADGAAAGLYFQLAEGECFAAGGLWMPARPALNRVREAIDQDPEALDELVRAPAFRRRFRELTPEAVLSRMPRGYAESHPAAGWLRYQSFTASRDMPEREVLSPRLPDILARDFAALVPLVRWLNQAIGYSSRDRRF
ncbi:MAG TPA: TIGR02453 family protein [Gemmatimonadales bacterium]|nr:TIGR02453 family protein [Gemmatimonadales bacterium]